MVTTRKLKMGVPSHLSQPGILNPMPIRVVHSDAAPIGQNKPHQLRPVKRTEANTSGNQTPHKRNCANNVKFEKILALSGWGGVRNEMRIKPKKRQNMAACTSTSLF